MTIGALIITTGLPGESGVAALLRDAGAISAGQRMISAFQCADVALTALVVGPEDKKAERQLAQNGVIFLRCEDSQLDFYQGIRRGLSFMQDKFDRVFLVPGDTPLFLPGTLNALLSSNGSIAVPESGHMQGYPVLLDKKAMALLAQFEDLSCAESSIREGALDVDFVRVEDVGILLRSGDMTHRQALIQNHNLQLSRPEMEVTLCSCGPVYDPRLSMLLHLVEHTRSVRDACSLMQMSYSAAWNMLNHVEDELGFPLVVRIRGGSTGSGSELTEKGRLLMDAYDRFSLQMKTESKALFRQIFNSMPEFN